VKSKDRNASPPAAMRLGALVLSALLAGLCFAQDEAGGETLAEPLAVPPAEPPVEPLVEPLAEPASLDIDELYAPLTPEPIHGQTALELVDVLESRHYLPIEIDDDFSSLAFDNFIDVLDSDHLYFLREDIDYLSRWRYNIDDHLHEGSLAPGYEIYNLYYKRLLERLVRNIDQIENRIPEMDFTIDEHLVIDREEAPYAETVPELDEIWRLRAKNSVLNLRIAGDSNEEIREKLSKRYRERLRRVLQTNSKDVFQSFLTTVARVSDPHTAYYSPQDSETFNMGLSLSLQGIGASLTTEGEHTVIAALIKGGPAERSKQLQAGDRIIGIGQGPAGEIQDVVGMRLDDVVAQIRGEKDTVVRLNVIPANAVNETVATVVSITRDMVRLEDQSAWAETITIPHPGGEGSGYQVGIIHLPTFYFDFEAAARGEEDFKSTTRDVRVLLEELKAEPVDAILVDLRNNGGGSLGEANQLVGLFIETGATGQVRSAGLGNGYRGAFGDNAPGVAWEGPLAVLVNRNSASASEIFAGAIQDYQRGLVLGGQTFGKGTVQEIVPMGYGQAKLTRSKFYRVSGASTQHRGIIPDILFPDMFQAYDHVGESSLDGALPWDTVRPVEYRAYQPIREFLPALRELHDERALKSPELIYLNDQIAFTKLQQQRRAWPLNETRLKAEMEAERLLKIELENMRRFLKGLPLLDVLEEDAADGNVATVEASPEEPEPAPESETEATAPRQELLANDAGESQATATGQESAVNDASESETGQEIAASDASDDPVEAEGDEDEALDALLEESARVLADYMHLSDERQLSAARP